MMDADALNVLLATGARSLGLREVDGFEPHYLRLDGSISELPEKMRDLPRRIRQSVDVYDPQSFIEYFGVYCNQSSRVFVDRQNAKVVAVLDYHIDGTSETIAPRWGDHRLNYVFRPTLEWAAWKSNDRKPIAQIVFAEFIEDNLLDIVHPTHAEMLYMSRKFEAKKDVQFSSATNLENGEIQFCYTEDVRSGSKQDSIEAPKTFTILVAPFEGSDKVEIKCRFRFTLKDQSLTLRYEMERPQVIVEAAVDKAIAAIRQVVNKNTFTYGVIAAAK